MKTQLATPLADASWCPARDLNRLAREARVYLCAGTLIASLLQALEEISPWPATKASEQERMRDDLLAELPVRYQFCDESRDMADMLATRGGAEAAIVTGWLRAARDEGR